MLFLDIDECEETPGVCDQICENKNGGYRCRCMPGYRRISKGKCVGEISYVALMVEVNVLVRYLM